MKTNNKQKTINEKAVSMYYAAIQERPRSTEKQLRHCTATVFQTENFIVLRSYNTIVAVIDKRDKSLYDVLRYVYGFTSTSCQHIAKFRHDYTPYPWNSPVYTYREVK